MDLIVAVVSLQAVLSVCVLAFLYHQSRQQHHMQKAIEGFAHRLERLEYANDERFNQQEHAISTLAKDTREGLWQAEKNICDKTLNRLFDYISGPSSAYRRV